MLWPLLFFAGLQTHALEDPHCWGGPGAGGGDGVGPGVGLVPLIDPLITLPSDLSDPTISFNQHSLPLEGMYVQPTHPVFC